MALLQTIRRIVTVSLASEGVSGPADPPVSQNGSSETPLVDSLPDRAREAGISTGTPESAVLGFLLRLAGEGGGAVLKQNFLLNLGESPPDGLTTGDVLIAILQSMVDARRTKIDIAARRTELIALEDSLAETKAKHTRMLVLEQASIATDLANARRNIDGQERKLDLMKEGYARMSRECEERAKRFASELAEVANQVEADIRKMQLEINELEAQANEAS